MLLLTALAAMLAVPTAMAEPVQIKPGLLRLNASLELPDGKRVADGIALILHGTMSHHRQETVAALQKNLTARGIGSLAVTLSLGIDDRQGPRACDVLHDYALAGAQREVGQWISWLKAQGARDVDLIGFSRGGAQIASFARTLPSVGRVVLLAPAFATDAEQAVNYQRAFGHTLAEPLEAARKQPLQKQTVDFLLCKQAPVLGATFLDGYRELPVELAAGTGHPTLVIVAGKDDIVPDLAARLPTGVQRVVVEGSGHFFPDLYGEDAADAIARYLKGQ